MKAESSFQLQVLGVTGLRPWAETRGEAAKRPPFTGGPCYAPRELVLKSGSGKRFIRKQLR